MLHRTGRLGGARFLVTDRWGGVSRGPYAELNLGDHVGDETGAVAENRRRLADAAGVAPERLAFMRQVHGADVAVLDRPPAPGDPPPAADALVSASTDLALAVLVADCVPVLLAGPAEAGDVVAVAHAGRRGVRAGVVPATVEAMARLGARPGQLSAYVGPAVCGACYEVPADMQEELAQRHPAARVPTRQGTHGLDLRAAVRAQLAAAGVTDVATDPACTVEDGSLFSHRRDGTSGRFAGVVRWGP
jgi:YfiH family protein